MNKLNKKTAVRLVIILALVLVLLLGVVAMMLLRDKAPSANAPGTQPGDLVATGEPGQPAGTQPGAPEQPEQPEPSSPDTPTVEYATLETGDEPLDTTPPMPDEPLATPYGTLKFPGKWKEFLVVKTKDGKIYTLEFSAKLPSGKTQSLYTIGFGGDESTAMGTVKNKKGELVPVQVSSANFDPDSTWSDSEKIIVYSMLDTINDMLDQLDLLSLEQVPQLPPQTDSGDMIIDTARGQLHYPAGWAAYLDLELSQDPCSAAFYCKLGSGARYHLFTIYYGGTAGIPIQTVTDANGETVELRVEMVELDVSGLSAQDKATVQAMQEDLNYLISHL